jgi:hypothetical protein
VPVKRIKVSSSTQKISNQKSDAKIRRVFLDGCVGVNLPQHWSFPPQAFQKAAATIINKLLQVGEGKVSSNGRSMLNLRKTNVFITSQRKRASITLS